MVARSTFTSYNNIAANSTAPAAAAAATPTAAAPLVVLTGFSSCEPDGEPSDVLGAGTMTALVSGMMMVIECCPICLASTILSGCAVSSCHWY